MARLNEPADALDTQHGSTAPQQGSQEQQGTASKTAPTLRPTGSLQNILGDVTDFATSEPEPLQRKPSRQEKKEDKKGKKKEMPDLRVRDSIESFRDAPENPPQVGEAAVHKKKKSRRRESIAEPPQEEEPQEEAEEPPKGRWNKRTRQSFIETEGEAEDKYVSVDIIPVRNKLNDSLNEYFDAWRRDKDTKPPPLLFASMANSLVIALDTIQGHWRDCLATSEAVANMVPRAEELSNDLEHRTATALEELRADVTSHQKEATGIVKGYDDKHQKTEEKLVKIGDYINKLKNRHKEEIEEVRQESIKAVKNAKHQLKDEIKELQQAVKALQGGKTSLRGGGSQKTSRLGNRSSQIRSTPPSDGIFSRAPVSSPAAAIAIDPDPSDHGSSSSSSSSSSDNSSDDDLPGGSRKKKKKKEDKSDLGIPNKMRVNPDKFDGTSPPFNHWKISLYNKFTAEKLNSEQARMITIWDYVKDNAARSLAPCLHPNKGHYTTHTQMLDHLAAVFEDPLFRERERQKFYKIKQYPEEKFARFKDRFLTLALNAGISRPDYRQHLLEGLKDELWTEVDKIKDRFETFNDLCDEILRQEIHLEQLKFRQKSRITPSNRLYDPKTASGTGGILKKAVTFSQRPSASDSPKRTFTKDTTFNTGLIACSVPGCTSRSTHTTANHDRVMRNRTAITEIETEGERETEAQINAMAGYLGEEYDTSGYTTNPDSNSENGDPRD